MSAAPAEPGGSPARRRVWDAPVRITHVAFIAAVAGAWLTRDARDLDAHAAFGYLALLALAFRIAWGFLGTAHARFESFAYPPRDAWRYVRDALAGRARHYTGHNPAGSWAVFVLLALLAAACVSGLLAIAAMHAGGPLGGYVPAHWGLAAWRWHEWLAWAVLAMVALHLAGVAWGSRVHRENLAAAMVTGRKRAHETGPDVPARALLAATIALGFAASGFAYLGWHVPRDVASREALHAHESQALQGTAWGRECGSCHLAYPPPLLPARSWRRMFDEQERHFGEDLALDTAAVAKLLAEAAHAPPRSWAAATLAASAPGDTAPLRITELPFWRRAHENVEERDFEARANGRHDCEACHHDAASGIFHPRMIRIPKQKVAS